MSTTDWIINIALMLVVLLQVREARLDVALLLVPAGLVTWASLNYLHAVPTAGNDLWLIGILTAAGATLGVLGGLATHVRTAQGRAYIRAGALAAVLWVLGMGSRTAFTLWTDHGGASSVAHFSAEHRITGPSAWVAAFVFMALAEVVIRLGTIFLRVRLALGAARRTAPRTATLSLLTPLNARPGTERG